eukprot:11626188-Alexandrium_andersonii.AAC.1
MRRLDAPSKWATSNDHGGATTKLCDGSPSEVPEDVQHDPDVGTGQRLHGRLWGSAGSKVSKATLACKGWCELF